MKYCYNCRRITIGEPLFCNFCGRSYDVKLCPRLHPNPRAAEVCSQCGSRELSIPEPKIPFWSKPLLMLLGILPGMVLLLLLLALAFDYVNRLVNDPNGVLGLVVIALVLGILLRLWMQLPAFVRRGFGRLFKGSAKRDHTRHQP